jgi:AAA15 family ATPase/GTPase
MRIDRLWLANYKNLRDVTIDFDESEWVTVVIGWNGTGKSNVLEALTIIFRDLIFTSKKHKSKFRPAFSYRIYYECSGHLLFVHADAEKLGADSVRIRAKSDDEIWKFDDSDLEIGTPIRLSQLSEDGSKYTPQFVFGYYSGESPRLAQIFREYTEDFDKQLRGGKDPGLKRLFYARPEHSNYVLLSFILQKEENIVRSFLVEQLGLDPSSGIDSLLFVMSQPSWKSKEGDARFWNARGIVSKFLDRLYAVSVAPIRLRRQVQSSLWNKREREFLYLYVKDLDSLRELAREHEPRQFFRDLESTHVSELIDEVRIRVRLKKNDGSVTFRELSEGEQQLLTVLGLLRFTKERESLFLLDEPDTHLNPRWAVDYIQYLKKFAAADSNGADNSHIVLTTHNPLAIAELVKEQVQILYHQPGTRTVRAENPAVDPKGMGYSGIVTSDMFGLGSSLDKPTNEDLMTLHQLSTQEQELNEANRAQLVEIRERLKGLDFNFASRDRLEQEYLRARFDLSEGTNFTDPILTPENKQAALKALVESLIANLHINER